MGCTKTPVELVESDVVIRVLANGRARARDDRFGPR
jgi:hypothetical protein